MENLHFEEPSRIHRRRYGEMMDEWEDFGGKINPGALRRYSRELGRNLPYRKWLAKIEAGKDEQTCPPGKVPQRLYFLMDDHKNILGAVCIRPKLSDELLLTGGHIGYGIRPSQRRRGYAIQMLHLALPLVKELGVERVLITCNKDNIGSAKTILYNGGILENEVTEEDGTIVQRYWIDLRDSNG